MVYFIDFIRNQLFDHQVFCENVENRQEKRYDKSRCKLMHSNPSSTKLLSLLNYCSFYFIMTQTYTFIEQFFFSFLSVFFIAWAKHHIHLFGLLLHLDLISFLYRKQIHSFSSHFFHPCMKDIEFQQKKWIFFR